MGRIPGSDDMNSDSIITRLVVRSDVNDIFLWRNDEGSRSQCLKTEPVVAWIDHQEWIQSVIISSRHCFLMRCDKTSDASVGVVRFDMGNDDTLISINLAPSFRGRGLGKHCLNAAIHFFSCHYQSVKPVRAEIRPENLASQKAFQGAGFKFLHSTNDIITLTRQMIS